MKYGEERETKQEDAVLTHGNWWMNQDEASVKQENKNITPEPWQTVEARRDIVNILKSHHSADTVGFFLS